MTDRLRAEDIHIRVDDLDTASVQQLVRDHLADAASHSPPESTHALNVEALKSPGVVFFSAWQDSDLLGLGALQHLDTTHVEIKSMKTAPAHLRRGVARLMLQHLVAEAQKRGYSRVSLETGSMAAFEPARRLYASFGFVRTRPFADYTDDPNSIFMSLAL